MKKPEVNNLLWHCPFKEVKIVNNIAFTLMGKRSGVLIYFCPRAYPWRNNTKRRISRALPPS
jgi:hypothetical protein